MDHKAVGLTDVGRKRDHNEDFLTMKPDLGLYIVCDGMGGHAAGEVASEMTATVISKVVQKNFSHVIDFMAEPNKANRERVKRLLEAAVQRACKDVFEAQENDPSKKGMGTTVVLALVVEEGVFVAHVGDSRCYLYRQGQTHQITEDHSLVNEYVKQGLMSREEAQKHPQANLITRGVGLQPTVQVDTLYSEVMDGDLFLLCSDGLSEYMKDSDYTKMAQTIPLEELAPNCIALANARGGKDNITALLMQMGDPTIEAKADNVAKKAEMLKKIPLFKNFDYQEITKLLEVIEVHKWGPGELILEENFLGEEMYIILTGKVEVIKGELKVAELKPGHFFGELSLIDKTPRSASIRSISETKMMVIHRKPLFSVLKKESRVAMKLFWGLLQTMSKRLRTTDEEVVRLKEMVESGNQSEDKDPAYGADLSFLDE
ncbi:MAG: protein phosphatase [Halobacteriovorax sp.]|nr:protein phosphatase [Halobacteriovorax sp.]|tara:strand:+ start:131392 stop:132684 length:1293 start_codon:yes stop_codon:yes gene_type:complete